MTIYAEKIGIWNFITNIPLSEHHPKTSEIISKNVYKKGVALFKFTRIDQPLNQILGKRKISAPRLEKKKLGELILCQKEPCKCRCSVKVVHKYTSIFFQCSFRTSAKEIEWFVEITYKFTTIPLLNHRRQEWKLGKIRRTEANGLRKLILLFDWIGTLHRIQNPLRK